MLLDLLVAMPLATHKQIAHHMGVSEGWVSTVYNTDLFQRQLRGRLEKRGDAAMLPLVTKVQALASHAVSRLAAELENEPDVEKIQKTAEMALKMNGFSTAAPVERDIRPQLHIHADAQAIMDARERMGHAIYPTGAIESTTAP